jgi:hypothetical protein
MILSFAYQPLIGIPATRRRSLILAELGKHHGFSK